MFDPRQSDGSTEAILILSTALMIVGGVGTSNASVPILSDNSISKLKHQCNLGPKMVLVP